MKTTFKTLKPHKAGTDIEVHGERMTFDAAGFGWLTTDTPKVIERLRAIPEGFVEVDARPTEDVHDAPEGLYGSSTLPSAIDLGAKPLPLGDVVAGAFAATGLKASAWNSMTAWARDALLLAHIDTLRGPRRPGDETVPEITDRAPDGDPPPVGEFVIRNAETGEFLNLAGLADEQLRDFVVANKLRVHGRAKGDTLRRAIVDALAGKPEQPEA